MKKCIIAMVLVLGSSGLAWGFSPGGPGYHGKGPGVEMFQVWFELDLSDVQKSQAASILKEYRDDILRRRTAVREAFEQAREFRSEIGQFNEDEVRKAHELISAARVEMLVLKDRIVSELFVLLSPEQQEILKDNMGKHRPPARPGGGKPMGEQSDELPLLDAFIKVYN
ncbi:Spy/CpxP family protein refolding chaperone [Desulfovibrio ferrophilus]|uniref:Periplasmic heavy metal sensor n=1 Tax=Desulfovibrio ferrophilus TaxID=241368 RepID=A0A2Z6AWS8_9BACT|nr:Spy/CpxP family protein refolding chaperone [Desulfovibrio ferrophilus]BBD07670.1 uncharacterized protein DFE_0944 [Desulfovibrio ferrophilus]